MKLNRVRNLMYWRDLRHFGGWDLRGETHFLPYNRCLCSSFPPPCPSLFPHLLPLFPSPPLFCPLLSVHSSLLSPLPSPPLPFLSLSFSLSLIPQLSHGYVEERVEYQICNKYMSMLTTWYNRINTGFEIRSMVFNSSSAAY